jgi:hypothetical protein
LQKKKKKKKNFEGRRVGVQGRSITHSTFRVQLKQQKKEERRKEEKDKNRLTDEREKIKNSNFNVGINTRTHGKER